MELAECDLRFIAALRYRHHFYRQAATRVLDEPESIKGGRSRHHCLD
ncbi:MAG: hypothetical protein KME40_16825 [Komarekiella atlantica HA4396-MV6]|nr:hypothetical protein [Komarekiella atlantica HA4396-MV6]